LIEKDRDKILFDPGKFSFVEGRVRPEQFQQLSAVILTHQHPDHVDDEALKQIMANNPPGHCWQCGSPTGSTFATGSCASLHSQVKKTDARDGSFGQQQLAAR
jgi:ribonuclease BN (tRNA processing enzyme)